MTKGLIFISGEKIGYQFNSNSMGERKVVRTVNVDSKNRHFITYLGMNIEVVSTGMKDADGNEVYNAVGQIVEEIEGEVTNDSEDDNRFANVRPLSEIAAELIECGKQNLWYHERGLQMQDLADFLEDDRPAYITPNGHILVQPNDTAKVFFDLGYL